MQSDRSHWNAKFTTRANQLLPPEPFLVRNIRALRPGTVLDLACGDGRNAIFLAKAGFAVTAMDISDVALDRLRKFAEAHAVSISIRQRDLDDGSALEGLGSFDNVVINHYRPAEHLLRGISRLLGPGGRALICAFNMKQHELDGTPEKLCLKVGEYKDFCSELQVLHYESFTEADRFLDGYIFQKCEGG